MLTLERKQASCPSSREPAGRASHHEMHPGVPADAAPGGPETRSSVYRRLQGTSGPQATCCTPLRLPPTPRRLPLCVTVAGCQLLQGCLQVGNPPDGRLQVCLEGLSHCREVFHVLLLEAETTSTRWPWARTHTPARPSGEETHAGLSQVFTEHLVHGGYPLRHALCTDGLMDPQRDALNFIEGRGIWGATGA